MDLFATICWWLWRRRNLFLFEEKTISNEAVIASSMGILSNLRKVQCKLSGVLIPGSCLHKETQAWQPPAHGWIKMNVDGAFSHSTSACASGGVLRNDDGRFIRGFIHRLEGGDALHAELWACLLRLKLAWDGGYRKLVLESDSSNALNLISADADEHHADHGVIKEIREIMLAWDLTVKLQHVSRSHNRAADFLAKQRLLALSGFHLVVSVSAELLSILDSDRTTIRDRVSMS